MSEKIPEKMIGMKLPGGAKVEKVECDVPKPGPGQPVRQRFEVYLF